MVLPQSLLARYRRDFATYANTVSRFEQQTLCEFMAGGLLYAASRPDAPCLQAPDGGVRGCAAGRAALTQSWTAYTAGCTFC